MATERLIVELDAKSQKLEAALKSTNSKLDQLENKASKGSKSLTALSMTGNAAAKGVRAVGSAAKIGAQAVTALAAAVGAAAAASSQYAKELKINSDLTKTSIEETQLLAGAYNSVGFSIEKMGDISKDTSEKIGDFLNTGGGGFMDFVDAMQLTESEAVSMAKTFQGMSGNDVLAEMVRQMEGAGVSSEQMSHALEGMASDTTRLIPLLSNGASEMSRLKSEIAQTTTILSSSDVTALEEMSGNFSSVYQTFKGTLGKISVEYKDEINLMLESTQEGLKFIGDEFASGAFTQRFNAFLDAYSSAWSAALGDTGSMFNDLEVDWSGLAEDMAKIWLNFSLTLPITLKKAGMQAVEFFNDIIDEIMIKVGEANVLMQQGLESIGIGGDVAGAEVALEKWKAEIEVRDQKADAEIQALEREKQAIIEKFVLEQELANEARENYANDTQERIDLANKEYEEEKKRLEDRRKNKEKENKKEKKEGKEKEKNKKDEGKLESELANQSIQLANYVFGENKAISATTAFINTAQGVTKALSEQNYAGAAITAATGAVQISSILSAEKGSGGAPSAPSASAPQQDDFQPESSSLEITEQVAGEGVTTQRIIISTDDGNDIFDGIARGLENRARSGA